MKKVAVVIPIYHIELDYYESISLMQCRKVLSHYDIFFLMPHRLRDQIGTICNPAKTIEMPDYCFDSISSYNMMMMQKEVYLKFEQYKYILIYQLDAFVFRDELDYYCDLGYDYIGAPWLDGMIYYTDIKTIPVYHVGNGGLSLRNVEKCLKVLELNHYIDFVGNEDVFWSINNSDIFRVAPIDIALSFSFELRPRLCFVKNNKRLPFGCHKWMNYDVEFWRNYIEQEGFILAEQAYGDIDENLTIYQSYLEFADKISINRAMLKRIDNNSFSRIIIWGAGNKGKECGWLLLHNGIKVDRYVDSDKSKIGKKLWDIKINNPTEIDYDNSLVIITPKKEEQSIIKQLNSIKIKNYILLSYSCFIEELKHFLMIN